MLILDKHSIIEKETSGHMYSTGIPDDWFQEDFVPIAQDNTYYYNATFSKQNKENTFTHLPPDWKVDSALQTIHSEQSILMLKTLMLIIE